MARPSRCVTLAELTLEAFLPADEATAAVLTGRATMVSERYRTADEARFLEQAAAVFAGDISLVHDLDRVPLPPRRQ